ncbi:MAG TPA: thioredoxin-dependent thiol peroxidase [Acidimicrobiales bacterium]|nr:thioredoxin-dependent thiol peroxidase [Acidimicrobiales bacterium]
MARLEPGTRAPAFSLPNQDDETVSLADFAGERLVVYFYPADDTPGCTTEACQFNDQLAGFSSLSVRVLGVSPDDPASHRAFRAKYGLSFDLLSDRDRAVMERYGAYGEKTLYGKKVLGVIRSTVVIGPDGRVEHAFYGVRANGHAERVLASLR